MTSLLNRGVGLAKSHELRSAGLTAAIARARVELAEAEKAGSLHRIERARQSVWRLEARRGAAAEDQADNAIRESFDEIHFQSPIF